MIGKAAFVLGLALLANPALALESAPATSSRVVASLISDTDAVRQGEALHVALRLRIKPGWHTYWSNPGDAGAPPEVTLTLPAGTQAGPITWPTPQRLPEGPVMAYGYEGEVVLPLSVTPGAGALEIKAAATWLVCETICVPEGGDFTLSLPAGNPAPSPQAPLFASAASRAPRPSPFEQHVAADGTLSLDGPGLSAATVRDAWFFPSEPDLIDQDAPQRLQAGPGFARLALKPGTGFHTPLQGVVVLVDQAGQQTSLVVSASPGPSLPAAPAYVQTLLLAMLGGLLLNLMPCVFPILAMKALALSMLSGQSRRIARWNGVSYTAGVMVSFAALGLALLALRDAGERVGWGFQFQSPLFVAATAWVLFAVGLNLSGVFGVGAGLAGAGQALTARRGYAGSFFTGVLAVLVATPCTAPFMGAAIAAALAAPPAATLAIFLAMGAGLAAPYALLGLLPGLAAWLPRPGPWMSVFKGALAFPMYAAVAWLVWVVSLQAGPDGVLGTSAGLVLIAAAASGAALAQRSGRRLAYGVTIAGVAGALCILPAIGPADPAGVAASQGPEAFTPARLATLRDEGRPVFVNMTAAWCVTCLVNERLALSSTAVRQAFSAHHVAYLKGDWTRSDPSITAYLQGFARDGVPLYVLYPGGAGSPSILPQVLTEAEVLSRLDKLGG